MYRYFWRYYCFVASVLNRNASHHTSVKSRCSRYVVVKKFWKRFRFSIEFVFSNLIDMSLALLEIIGYRYMHRENNRILVTFHYQDIRVISIIPHEAVQISLNIFSDGILPNNSYSFPLSFGDSKVTLETQLDCIHDVHCLGETMQKGIVKQVLSSNFYSLRFSGNPRNGFSTHFQAPLIITFPMVPIHIACNIIFGMERFLGSWILRNPAHFPIPNNLSNTHSKIIKRLRKESALT